MPHPTTPAGANGPARLSRCNHDYAVGSWANVFVIIWRHDTSASGVIQVRKDCERFGQLHPDGVFLLTIIQAEALPPPSPVRAALAAFLKAGHYIRASSVVMEGHSLRAAIVRSVVTGLTLLARQPFPHQVCSLDEAGVLFERTSRIAQHAFSRPAFAAAIGELRGQIERMAIG